MRAASAYLAQFVKELNSVQPTSARAYEFVYLGKLEGVKLVQARIEERPLHVEGRKVCEHVALHFRIEPSRPATASVSGDDILRCKQYLASLNAVFKAQAETRNDAGRITRALFTVTGALPCEINLRADYTGLAVLIELVNVRRLGRVQARIPPDLLADVVDDLARYAIGVDDDFEKVLKKEK